MQRASRQDTRETVAVCCSILQCVAEGELSKLTTNCCSVLQCVATQCHTLSYTAIHCKTKQERKIEICRNKMQYTATRCNTLQHIATHCNTLQHTATHCNTLQHTATHLQHTATHCNTPASYRRAWGLLVQSPAKFSKVSPIVIPPTGCPQLVGTLQLQVLFAKKPQIFVFLLQKIHKN